MREKELIPVPAAPISEGFKYICFQLKPNAFQDWTWLYKNIETRISMWDNRFLSRGRCLVLLKVVLQSIPIYWDSIAYIPKGISMKIRKKYLSFMWTTSKQSEGIPLVKWSTIVLPKSKGGWGIKNTKLFCKALAAKLLWRMVENMDTLWGRAMRSKYCPQSSI